jgi:hypothetical protein
VDGTIETGFDCRPVDQEATRILQVGSGPWSNHHGGDRQILNRDEVEVVHQPSAQLVGGVHTLLFDAVVQSRHLQNLTATSLRPTLPG